ncbi:uncharacterized protein LOC126585153 isoform X2 [Malus sylvestris]|uniref:uncharacterized protein LOC126585153 isoform X2 n=1 Tax=Malus sylvestris TaxID=3752 RepID=UPI0021AC3BB8|nr:uncharacterized protein LOC126585153 isoform X2 [Malus sylvestris]
MLHAFKVQTQTDVQEPNPFKFEMYPKVKVRLHDQQEDQFSPQDDHRKLLLANIHAGVISRFFKNEYKLTMEAYAPKLPRQSISSSKENSKNLGKATTPDAKACLVLRPRAVLSSPENDGMIGSINKIVDRKNSPAIKVQNPNTATSSAQRPHQEAKKAPSQAKKKATATARPMAMNTNKGSNIKTLFNSNNGDVKSKFQKPLVGKQHASLGTWKPSFTSS